MDSQLEDYSQLLSFHIVVRFVLLSQGPLKHYTVGRLPGAFLIVLWCETQKLT